MREPLILRINVYNKPPKTTEITHGFAALQLITGEPRTQVYRARQWALSKGFKPRYIEVHHFEKS